MCACSSTADLSKCPNLVSNLCSLTLCATILRVSPKYTFLQSPHPIANTSSSISSSFYLSFTLFMIDHLILLERIAVRIPGWPSTHRIALLVPWMYGMLIVVFLPVSSPVVVLLLTLRPSARFRCFFIAFLRSPIIILCGYLFSLSSSSIVDVSLPLLLPFGIRNSLAKRPSHWTFGIVRVVGWQL